MILREILREIMGCRQHDAAGGAGTPAHKVYVRIRHLASFMFDAYKVYVRILHT